MTIQRYSRRGIAIMWTLVILVVLGTLSATAAWQFTAGRRSLERRQHNLQTLWLARSGAELAAARLIADADGYSGETVQLIAESDLRIVVEKDATDRNKYRIRCEARYPASGPESVSKVLSWSATRRSDPIGVRLERLEPDEPPPP